MPLAYRIDPDTGIMRTTATGVLTDADVLAHKAAMIDDPAYHPGMKELADLRGIERLDVTPTGIRTIVGYDRDHAEHFHDHRVALVAAADVVYGMARMYQSLAADALGAVQVFRTIEEAERWLGVG